MLTVTIGRYLKWWTLRTRLSFIPAPAVASMRNETLNDNTLDDRIYNLEKIRFEYRLREIHEKVNIIKVLLDDLVFRVANLEAMNRDDGK